MSSCSPRRAPSARKRGELAVQCGSWSRWLRRCGRRRAQSCRLVLDRRSYVGRHRPTSGHGQLTVVTDGSDRMAVGGELESEDGDGAAVVFTSADGLRWSEVKNRAPLPAAAVPSHGGAAPLVANDDTWVLAPRQGGPGAGTVWVSTDDGETWERSVTGETTVVRSGPRFRQPRVCHRGHARATQRAASPRAGPSCDQRQIWWLTASDRLVATEGDKVVVWNLEQAKDHRPWVLTAGGVSLLTWRHPILRLRLGQ